MYRSIQLDKQFGVRKHIAIREGVIALKPVFLLRRSVLIEKAPISRTPRQKIAFHKKIMGPDYYSLMNSVFFERFGVVLILFGSSYICLGLLGVVPLELTGVSISNIRIPAGIAIVGCLIAAFSTKNR